MCESGPHGPCKPVYVLYRLERKRVIQKFPKPTTLHGVRAQAGGDAGFCRSPAVNRQRGAELRAPRVVVGARVLRGALEAGPAAVEARLERAGGRGCVRARGLPAERLEGIGGYRRHCSLP